MKLRKLSLLAALAVGAICTPSHAEDVPEALRSKNFDAVSAHLDLGGDIYAYLDIDGDAEKVATIFQGFLDMVKEQAPRGEIPPQIAALKFTEVSKDLGLSGMAALGMSSFKNGDLYRNKYYVHIPEGREGFFEVFGGDAGPFAAQKLAPAGTDILMEQELDLKSAFELIGALALKYGGPEAAAEMLEGVREEIVPGLSIAEIFAHLDTEIIIVGQVHPDKPMALPEEVPLDIPGFDMLMSIEGLGPIFTKLVATMPAEQRPHLLQEGPGFVQINIPMPPEMAGIIQPVVRHELGTGRVLIATSATYVDKCVSGATSVWDDANFKEAMADLPEEGNSLSFVSGEFMGEYLRVYSEILEMAAKDGGMPMGMSEMIIGMMAEFGLDPDHSQARVAVNLPEGILVVENSGASAKQTIAAAGFGFVMGFAGMTTYSMAAPMPYDAEMDETFSAPPKVQDARGDAEKFDDSR